ncbi:MAG: D-ribose pyranase [Candidatus Aldehydirespiratoraceae bacterium]|jgi:D-ribose pyranase
MRSGGIIHPELARVIASLGHLDRLCVADAGLPIPPGVVRIDLAYRLGQPGFVDVVEALAAELVIEEVTMAEEAGTHCPEVVAAVRGAFSAASVRAVAHEDFKKEAAGVRAVVRTGECTPYANVILTSGVPFA